MAEPIPPTDRDFMKTVAPVLSAQAQRALQHGNECLDHGDHARAEQSFAAGLRESSDHPDLLRGRAIALQRLQRDAEAIPLLRRVLELEPADAIACNTLGTALGAVGDTAAAVVALRRACELAPHFAASWFNLGKVLTLLARTDEALAPLQRALAIDPGFESARFLLAEALMMSGHSDDSAAQYREVLRHAPQSGLAWWGLANLKAVRLIESDTQRLAALVRQPGLAVPEHIGAAFAFGKALEDTGRDAEAFTAYREANAFARRHIPWNAAGFDAWLARLLAVFETPLPAPLDAQLGHEVIFIVGLPRSGSTLSEQILAAHPQVEGASELPDLGAVIAEESSRRRRPFPDWARDAVAADWQRLGQRYLERTARWRERRPRFTDKMPGNWLLIDAIRAMLPGAAIVDCRRDPLETCWSCFRQIFWQMHEYSYDIDDLAAYWHAHDRALRVWRERYPERIREQVYEELLADPEQQTRALLEFCGLPFDPACLRPHEATRSVRTASAAQVREPMRRDTARAPRYGALLDPLREALARPR